MTAISKMKIIAYTPILELSGAPMVFLELIQILHKNHNLTIRLAYKYSSLEAIDFIDNTNINLSSVQLESKRSFIKNAINILVNRPNLILVNTTRSSSIMLLSKLLRIKCICIVHETDDMLARQKWIRKIRYKAIRTCAAFISVSQTSMDWLINAVNVKKPIVKIPNGCDIKNFSEQRVADLPTEFWSWYNQTNRVVAFCGLLDERKGIAELEEICMTLNQSGMSLLIIGDFRDDHYSQAIKSVLLRYSNLYITGLTKVPLAYMQYCETLLFLSRAESYPRVIQEAIWSGLRVISYDVGDVKIMVDPNFDVVVEHGNLDKIKSAISEKHAKRDSGVATPIEEVANQYFDVISKT